MPWNGFKPIQSTAFHTKIEILKRRPGVEERAVQRCAATQRQVHGGAIHTQDLSSCQQGNRHLVAQIVDFPHIFFRHHLLLHHKEVQSFAVTRLSGQVPSWIKMVAPSGSLEVTRGTNLSVNNSFFIFINMVTLATFIIFRLSWGGRHCSLCHYHFYSHNDDLQPLPKHPHPLSLVSTESWFLLTNHNSQSRTLSSSSQPQVKSSSSQLVDNTLPKLIKRSCWPITSQNSVILIPQKVDYNLPKWDPLRLVLIVICNLCNPFLEECEARQMFVHTKHRKSLQIAGARPFFFVETRSFFPLLKQGLSFLYVETWTWNIWDLANWSL